MERKIGCLCGLVETDFVREATESDEQRTYIKE